MKERLQVTVAGLSKWYCSRQVLDNVNFHAEPGETVALIGPSGGGKSTFLRCLNGLCPFDAGEVRVGSHVLGAQGTALRNGKAIQVRRLLGMVFQDFQLFPHLTSLQNIIEAPLRVLRMARRDAIERGLCLLRRVGLEDYQGAYPHQLSGGQKQRVAIARALAMEPRGLLCDEITSALDPELKNDVLAVLEDLKGEGLTLLMVTHEIGFARRAADKIVVLADGRIVEEGPPCQVIDHPQADRTRLFLSRVLG
jgi:polar amino acid transport system ATP-binding protein